jgi:hypothetical protein
MMMVQAQSPPRPNVEQHKKVVHVEAQDIEQDEYKAFSFLLGDKIEVLPFQGNKSLFAAAQAFANTQPNWYFIVDRDYTPTVKVEERWENFPHGCKVLMWRKREFENYLLNPEWIHAGLLKMKENDELSGKIPSVKTIETHIVECANERWLNDAIHYVLHKQVQSFNLAIPNANVFGDCKTLEEFNTSLNVEIANLEKRLEHSFSGELRRNIVSGFQEHLALLAGVQYSELMETPKFQLKWGQGEWQTYLSGKEIWTAVTRKFLKTKARRKKLVEAMFGQLSDDSLYPEDFKEVKRLLNN